MRRRNARLLGVIAALLPLQSAGLVAPKRTAALYISEPTPSRRRLALGPARQRSRVYAAPKEDDADDSNLVAALSIAAAGAFGAGIYATMGAEKPWSSARATSSSSR